MARIKDASVEEVKGAADMVAVVSARTQLRKTGGRYMGRCPFHDERTPSFSVNPTDKLYYCFGCGAKGDLITFVRETEQLDFAAAIEWLADRFNVQLEYEETSPQQDAQRRRRDRLHALLDAAASFYERYLWDSQAGSAARDYLAGRGLGEEICREYRLGLALGGTTLARKATEKGFTRDEVLAAGEAATLRGMELAAAQGFNVHVVALPPGLDPADLAEGFEQRLGRATSYLLHRVRLEVERAPDRQEAFVRAREVLSRFEDSPERQRALRFVADRLDLPKETQAGLAPRGDAASTGSVSPRLLDAGDRLERNALAGVTANRATLVAVLAELGPDHFDSDLHRRVRALLVGEEKEDPEL